MRFVVAACLVSLFAASAHAERRVALVMGANGYSVLRPLGNAVNDAQTVAATLEKLGFEVSIETNRDLRRMRRALERFQEDGAGAQVALVFFAGHGMEIAGENRLLPVDANARSIGELKASSLPLEEITRTIQSVAPIAIVLLDACRNDPYFFAGTDRRSATVLESSSALPYSVMSGLGRVGRAENVLFAFSAAPGQTASDGSGANSPFTESLASHLGEDGLQVGSVLKLVQQDVYDRTRGQQLPFIEDGLPRLFFAGTKEGDLPEREHLLLAMADLTYDLRDQVERVATANDMPLAPLYAALIGAELQSLRSEDRNRKLADAAKAYVGTQEKLKILASSDPEVTRLRAEAEKSLALGALKQAGSYLDQAIAADRMALTAVQGILVERTVSQAASLIVKAGVARTALDHRAAIAALEEAASLHAAIEALELSDEARKQRSLLLADLGDLNRLVGDTNKALNAYMRMQYSATLRLTKSSGNQDDAESDLAVALDRTGTIETAMGKLTAALGSYRASLAIRERLAAHASGNSKFQYELSASLNQIGDVKTAQGDLAGALTSYRQALAIRERLAAENPDDTDRQRGLSISFNQVGDTQEEQGDLAAALTNYRKSLAIREALVARYPNNTRWQGDLAVSLNYIGDAEKKQGHLTTALENYSRSFAIRAILVARDPGNTAWQRDLAISFNHIGDVQREQADLDSALASYRKALAIRERLVALDPGNAIWQRDLSLSFEHFGDVQRVRSDSAGALDWYRKSLAIFAPLAAADPGNTRWQRELGILLTEIGDVQVKQDGPKSALATYHNGLAIAERLAAIDSSDARWQRDLIAAYIKVAKGATDESDQVRRALDLALSLRKRGIITPADNWIVDTLRQELSNLEAAAK